MGSMSMVKTMSCSYQEITGLAGYPNRPEQAMIDFCQLNIAKRPRYGCTTSKQDTIYSFYTFNSAVKTPNVNREYSNFENTYYSVNYGQQFADFIVANGLGTVWASEILVNVAFHPDHSNQVFVWTPNHQAILDWWEKAQKTIVNQSVNPTENPS